MVFCNESLQSYVKMAKSHVFCVFREMCFALYFGEVRTFVLYHNQIFD